MNEFEITKKIKTDDVNLCVFDVVDSTNTVLRNMANNGCDEKTVVILNHFSHNGINSNYTEFEPIAKEKGFETSFDGMEINI